MPININTNISSINGRKNLNRTDAAIETPLSRLSSGKRINSAKDDAAGLAIVARMTSQILGTSVAVRNANDGISLAQVAEGALTESGEILQRVRELAVQSVNGTNSAADRQALQDEVGQLTAELNRIAGTTDFNGQKLLNGQFGTALFQVGPNANQTNIASTGNFANDQYGNYRLDGVGTSVAATDRLTTSGSLQIAGATGNATVNYSVGDSAATVAQSVNQVSDQTGVVATAKTEVTLQFGASGSYNLQLTTDNGNTQSIGFTLSASTGTEALTQAANAFNEHMTSTGVIATVNDDGSGITLTSHQGETMRIADTASANAGNVVVSGVSGSQPLVADAVTDTAVATGEVTLDSNASFSVNGTAGAVINNTGESAQLLQVTQLDVSSVASANDTLAIVDAAISKIAMQRASFGALQNKFASTIRNLETSHENLSAARSRIEDADYAKEVAELTRSMILKKSGMASLAHGLLNNQLALNLLNKP